MIDATSATKLEEGTRSRTSVVEIWCGKLRCIEGETSTTTTVLVAGSPERYVMLLLVP
jgi:hypothetical protein